MSQRRAWTMALPLPFLLAFRYLKSTRKHAFATFLSVLATGGIALGVAALILVLGGLAGLQQFLRGDVMSRTPHLEVALPREVGANENNSVDILAVEQELAALPGVVQVRRLLRSRGWMLAGGRPLDVEVIGFDGELPRFFPNPEDRAPGLYIDRGTANRWGLRPGDSIELVSPRPTLTPFGPQPRIHQVAVHGTFARGRTAKTENRIAVPLAVAEKLFGKRLTRLEIETAGFDEALELAPAVRALLPEGASLRTWRDLNSGLFFALRLERILMFVSVFLIVPVAAGALVTVLGLLISAKRGEIGMLQTMGAQAVELRQTFFILGLTLAALGLLLGVTVGVTTARIFDHYELIRPPGDVYFTQHIPFAVQGTDLLVIIVSTVLLTTLSAAWAAHRAASTRAVEALRL